MPHRTRRSRKFSAPPKLEGARRGRGRKERNKREGGGGRGGGARAGPSPGAAGRTHRQGPSGASGPGSPPGQYRPDVWGGGTDVVPGVPPRRVRSDASVDGPRRAPRSGRRPHGRRRAKDRASGMGVVRARRNPTRNLQRVDKRRVLYVCARTAGAGRARNGRRRGGRGCRGKG